MESKEWKEVSLDEVVDILGDGLHGTPNYDENGEYYFINGNNLNGKIIVNENTKKVGEEEYLKYKKNLNDRSILVSINGTLGKVAVYNGEKIVLGKSACYFNVKKDFNKDFIRYVMHSKEFKDYMDSHSTGTTIKNMGLKQMKAFKFYIPNILIQSKIATILTAIDERIETNNQIKMRMESMVQVIFKNWFVDFEFPNENGEPYKSSGGEMVESERGLIPKEFLVQLLAESTEFLSGGTPKTKVEEYWDGEIPFFTPKDITGSVYVTQTLKTITELGLSKSNSKLYPKDTIFITARGTVGKLNIANIEMAMNQSCFALKQKKGYQFFLYSMLETLVQQIIQGSNGAVFNAINLKDLNILKIVKPTDEMIANFENMVIPIFNLMSEKEKENISLKELRDTLLPRLLSGEIDLSKEIEKELNEIGT